MIVVGLVLFWLGVSLLVSALDGERPRPLAVTPIRVVYLLTWFSTGVNASYWLWSFIAAPTLTAATLVTLSVVIGWQAITHVRADLHRSARR